MLTQHKVASRGRRSFWIVSGLISDSSVAPKAWKNSPYRLGMEVNGALKEHWIPYCVACRQLAPTERRPTGPAVGVRSEAGRSRVGLLVWAG